MARRWLRQMVRKEVERKLAILREYKIRKARNNFWLFCNLLAPDFYKDNRVHLKELCDTLQKLYEGKLLKPNGEPYKRLILNLPP